MWEELGISGGTALVVLIALYFVIKWAVKNGIKEALSSPGHQARSTARLNAAQKFFLILFLSRKRSWADGQTRSLVHSASRSAAR